MNVVIVGAGEVGLHVASILSREAHNVTVVDSAEDKIRRVSETLDIAALHGHGATPETLIAAGAQSADLVLAVTDNDEINLIATFTAKRLGAKRVVARLNGREYLEASQLFYRDLLGIDLIVSPAMLTAYEIAKFVENPDALAIESFVRGRIEMRQARVTAESPLAAKPLKEIALGNGTLIASILRDDTLIIPSGESVIQPNDIITIIGQRGRTDRMQRLITGAETKVHNVMIFGGGQIGMVLAQLLENLHCSVRLLEEDLARCTELAGRLEKTRVVHGNGADLNLLTQEHVGQVDAFIAVTDDDERNIMAALLAKEQGAAMGIVLIHRPDFASLLEKYGIDHAVSPRLVAANRILSLVRRGELRSTVMLAEGKAEAIELRVAPGSRVSNCVLKDLRLPRDTLLAALIHDEQVIVPRGKDRLKVGDTVIALARPEALDGLVKLFQAS
ncbi:MAG: Trk system potassium transporter TrkA [Verrucomicrobia bacterium]|nr:Trk system potassium transporter TrkA [Verrucomicrobiota bacterium]